MSSTSHNSRHVVRIVLPVATAIVVIAAGATPSSARPEAGPPVARVGHAGECLLQRIGTQFVRCDNLTGNGVPAPAFISQR